MRNRSPKGEAARPRPEAEGAALEATAPRRMIGILKRPRGAGLAEGLGGQSHRTALGLRARNQVMERRGKPLQGVWRTKTAWRPQ